MTNTIPYNIVIFLMAMLGGGHTRTRTHTHTPQIMFFHRCGYKNNRLFPKTFLSSAFFLIFKDKIL